MVQPYFKEKIDMALTPVKHKLCRRVGSCIWGMAKCPSAKRPFAAGPHGKTNRSKLSTYGLLLRQKQILRLHYALTERQLRFVYRKSKMGEGQTGDKLLRNLEMRLSSVVFRSGLAPTIFAAKQAVVHGHIFVDGKRVNRNAFRVQAGQVISIDVEKSPNMASIAQSTNMIVPAYLEVDKTACKVTVAREPLVEEIPCAVDIMSVVEYYAR